MNRSAATLMPLSDTRHHWRALAVVGRLDGPGLTRWLEEFGLREALGPLHLVLPPLPREQLDAALLAALPRGRSVLLLDPGHAWDSAALAELQQHGIVALCALDAPLAVEGCYARAGSEMPVPNAEAALRLLFDVDTPQLFAEAAGVGWHWLGGRHALHLAPGAGTPQGGGRGIVMRLLGQLAGEAESSEIEATVKQDPQLSYQLLRLVNSAAFSLPREISSFGQAIAILGRRQLQRWLQLLLYANRNGHGASPLLPLAAWRACLMEQLSKRAGENQSQQDMAFMAGMFSLLDVLLAEPLEQAVAPLHLGDPVVAALLRGEGALGAHLRLVAAAADRSDAATTPADAGIATDAWLAAQAEAARWAIAVSREA